MDHQDLANVSPRHRFAFAAACLERILHVLPVDYRFRCSIQKTMEYLWRCSSRKPILSASAAEIEVGLMGFQLNEARDGSRYYLRQAALRALLNEPEIAPAPVNDQSHCGGRRHLVVAADREPSDLRSAYFRMGHASAIAGVEER